MKISLTIFNNRVDLLREITDKLPIYTTFTN